MLSLLVWAAIRVLLALLLLRLWPLLKKSENDLSKLRCERCVCTAIFRTKTAYYIRIK